MPAILLLLITNQEGLDALSRPDAVIEPAAIVRMSTFSNQARAVWPNMKSTAPTIRHLAYSCVPARARMVSWYPRNCTP